MKPVQSDNFGMQYLWRVVQVFHKLVTTGHQRLQPLFDCLLTIIVNGTQFERIQVLKFIQYEIVYIAAINLETLFLSIAVPEDLVNGGII
jgi:hypothetical protein